ncbi:hypothetical protein [Amycolatopsis sp. RTGN1]|uniref:hypothetical protein n=1 Tax=Amycolatopsis ponsaeliensis TaxID=2992142 RepID=UPI00254D5E98|nr:hypothetical protein [Amycolatopsis sp. RTGN1]
MDTSLTEHVLARHPLVLRVVLVAGALFGFTLLAITWSGAADASERTGPPGRPALLDRVGDTVHDALQPAKPALEPVTGAVHAVTSQVASVVKPVTRGLEPMVAPVISPVLHAAEPVLTAVRPVTDPVLHAVSPVTAPVLRATAPLTAPVVRAIGAEHVVPAVTGNPAAGWPAIPVPRDDIVASPAETEPVVVTQAGQQRRHDAGAVSRHVGGDGRPDAGPASGPDGGGPPAGFSDMSGAMSASPGGQHGGEYAVTTAGGAVPGTDRTWRAPPAGVWSLHWLEHYGNDHPS